MNRQGIYAKVVLDSISPAGIRLTTIQLRQPRMIHADFMTHREFSRNARSSRAVPVKRLLKEPIHEPVVYGRNQKGMSAGDELTGWRLFLARAIWRGMAHMTRLGVRALMALGLHKQWANRPLEWFGYIDVLVSSTNWANYEALRDDPAAQPEIQLVAQAVLDALDASTPTLLRIGDWHLPYITDSERDALSFVAHLPNKRYQDWLIKLSAARCARLSIEPFDGNPSIEAETRRYELLVGSQPVHASPTEHQATPDVQIDLQGRAGWEMPHLHGNFTGWCQARKMIPNERVTERRAVRRPRLC